MARLKARALRTGDTIGIVAPASPARSDEHIQGAVRYLEAQGYRVELGKHLRDLPGYLAATDRDRLGDLHSMVRNKNIRAIFFIRGGYGSIRLLQELNYDLLKEYPKIFVGYSDATSLFNAIYKKTGLASLFFGPMAGVDMWNGIDPFTEENFWKSVTSTSPFGLLPLADDEGILLNKPKIKESEGRMLGGNLTVFCSLLGTPYLPAHRNSIPFLEEIDEKPRKIDAYFAQLNHAGQFQSAGAILLGQFTGCDTDPDAPTLSLAEIEEHYFGKLAVPVIANLPFGHVARQWTVPLGVKMKITTAKGRGKIELMEQVLTKD